MQQLGEDVVKRERMWEAYHKLRTSNVLVGFLKISTAIGPCPIFYQYVADQLFKGMHFQVSAETGNGADETGLAYEEINELCYSAGYIPRALCKMLEQGSHPLKEELVLCLHEMTLTKTDLHLRTGLPLLRGEGLKELSHA